MGFSKEDKKLMIEIEKIIKLHQGGEVYTEVNAFGNVIISSMPYGLGTMYLYLRKFQNEIILSVINLVKYNNELRKSVEAELEGSFKDFVMASAVMSSEFLEEAVAYPKDSVSVEVGTKNIMSVNVPEMKFHRQLQDSEGSIYPYGFANTSSELDDAIGKLESILPKLLELAEVEKSTQLMADEIEKTRRRVNALEYMTIPQLQETIKFIRMKLDENERGALTRLMKVKDMINSRA